MRGVSAVLAAAVVAHGIGASAAGAGERALERRAAVIDKTKSVLVHKQQVRIDGLRARVRALYKLSRAGWAPLWLEGARRSDLLRRRAAARRILARDLNEIQILREELAAVLEAEVRVDDARAHAAPGTSVARGSLVRPVRGPIVSRFGRYRGRRSHTELTQRGIKLACARGEIVRAPHAGTITYAGPLRGLDRVVVIARGDGVRTVVGGLADAEDGPRQGAMVAAGEPLGTAARRRIYVEVRLNLGAGGLPVDPAPLLAH